MQVIGTAANENRHFVLNRRTKFTAHMRPDHTMKLVEYACHAVIQSKLCFAVGKVFETDCSPAG